MYGGAFYLFLKQYGMTQDIFHWEDVRRRLEIGVRKSIRHFSHCSYFCCNYTPGNLLVRYNVFDPLISQSISPFFERKLPLNYCTEFFWIIKFHYFSRNFGSFNLEYWHWVEVKMGWFLGGSYASLLNCFVCLMHTLPFITFLVVK